MRLFKTRKRRLILAGVLALVIVPSAIAWIVYTRP